MFQCCAHLQTSIQWWMPLEPSSHSVVLTCGYFPSVDSVVSKMYLCFFAAGFAKNELFVWTASFERVAFSTESSDTGMCERAIMECTTSSGCKCRSRASVKLLVVKRWRPHSVHQHRRIQPAPALKMMSAEWKSRMQTVNSSNRLRSRQVAWQRCY